MGYEKLSRRDIARLVASDIEDGAYVNLGIGIPTLVAAFLPPGRDVILHTENGIVGMGPGDPGAPLDLDLINASKEAVTLLPGASITDHVVSFAMMRGGHLDLTVLGAFQVSEKGDLANWDTGAADTIPAVGGAMDLVAGARQVYITMEHLTKDGQPKIVRECSYPLTGAGVVDRIYTDLAILDITPAGMQVRAMVAGLAFEELQELTGCPLALAAEWRPIALP
ncbi:3-oxoacid CoA-transferase subunit B [Bordetella pseudohinzii]|uniref:3-oxoadipate CoA-transferase n=1 Tax=Bordetella pseudohinzii TaxID=1331258 RepID=A0A0J6BRL8_9BORD|nr:3-oxoacid CoA-transferase subunit B [Bordetella pseudohinzii]ANY16113.1 3-oxoadipate CoA-transferase [Bordetella pseudohinzii]KMM24484.1 3-oxoadipate CoA-transferase [Bordetella pseudohinzii]KXA78510.1 3-oxoadipate CoA-transferase [Bordetella pseudohinzii]KXA78578.1 3-oxoadipate CoA-transferase [Bordetella pseudohinzii]CUJ10308.1 3-oxoadipate CoA-transferase subunit B [Bordetella pseudohinzii]